MGFDLTAEAAVEELTAKETFNVFDFIAAVTVPEDDITIYTDADAALKIAKILLAEKEAAKADDGLSITDGAEDNEELLTVLHARLVASGLTFHMKGQTPDERQKLTNEIKESANWKEGEENAEFNTVFNNTLIARSIVSVTNASGAVNTSKWTPKQVKGFLPSLYESEAAKLYDTTAELSYIGAIFDRAVSADFS